MMKIYLNNKLRNAYIKIIKILLLTKIQIMGFQIRK
jgi:hypothetical protein